MKTGLTIEQYWSYTPREVQIQLEYYREKNEDDLYKVWLGACLSKLEKFPTFEEILGKPKKDESRINYNRVERLAKENGLNIPESFYKDKEV